MTIRSDLSGPAKGAFDQAQQQAELHQAQAESASVNKTKLSAEIDTLDAKIAGVRAQLRSMSGERLSLRAKATLAKARELVGAGWAQASTNLGHGLAKMAEQLGQTQFTVTVTELEQDATAEKVSDKLLAQLSATEPDYQAHKEQLHSWTSSLEILVAERDGHAETVSNHAAKMMAHLGAMQEILRTGEPVISTAEREVCSAAAASVAKLDQPEQRPARKSFFAAFGDLVRNTANTLLGEKTVTTVMNRVKRLFVRTPVPVPVTPDTVAKMPGGSVRSQRLTPEQTDFPLVDARSIYELPAPRTSRDWVALAAGMDYSTLHAEGHKPRELDAALKAIRAPIRHQGQMAKDVKRHLFKRFGLTSKQDHTDLQLEVHRRLVAGVPRFTTAAIFESYLSKHNLPNDATPTQIQGAVVDSNASSKDLIGSLNALHGTEAFSDAARRLDDRKAIQRLKLGERPSPAAARRALDEIDEFHGKSKHTENAVNMAYAFLTDEEFRAAVPGLNADRIADAVTYLNLGDWDTPVEVIAARRKMTDDEFIKYVKPRPQNAANLYREFGLGDEATALLIEQHRDRERTNDAIMVDLINQLAALASKPFFQKDGVPDADKITGAIQQNTEKAGIPESLVAALMSGVQRGLLAEAQSVSRAHDQYVR